MVNWASILRAVTPELAKIVSAAAPAFTARQGMVGQQITELQQAVLSNAAAIKEVAEKSHQMAKALEELVTANQTLTTAHQATVRQLRQTRLLALAALAASIIAIIVAVVAVGR